MRMQYSLASTTMHCNYADCPNAHLHSQTMLILPPVSPYRTTVLHNGIAWRRLVQRPPGVCWRRDLLIGLNPTTAPPGSRRSACQPRFSENRKGGILTKI